MKMNCANPGNKMGLRVYYYQTSELVQPIGYNTTFIGYYLFQV